MQVKSMFQHITNMFLYDNYITKSKNGNNMIKILVKNRLNITKNRWDIKGGKIWKNREELEKTLTLN